MAFTLRRLTLTAGSAALCAAFALPVLAQVTPPAADPAAVQKREQKREQHAQGHAERLAALKTKLQITPAQETAWTAFTTSMQPGARPARLGRADMAQLTTPERIDRMRALRAQHAAEADRRGDAVKTFYAALSPEQQKTFDSQPMHRAGGPGKRHHGPH